MTRSLQIKFAFGVWVAMVEMAVCRTYARTTVLSCPMAAPEGKEVMFTSRQRKGLATCSSCVVHTSKAIMESQARRKREMEQMVNLSSTVFPLALRSSRLNEMLQKRNRRNLVKVPTT